MRCHGEQGEGKIGPNLTDVEWIGGGSPVDIYKTVYFGRAGKGMQSWGSTLGRGGSMQVAAFVITIRDTNVPGKAAEGQPWVAARRVVRLWRGVGRWRARVERIGSRRRS